MIPLTNIPCSYGFGIDGNFIDKVKDNMKHYGYTIPSSSQIEHVLVALIHMGELKTDGPIPLVNETPAENAYRDHEKRIQKLERFMNNNPVWVPSPEFFEGDPAKIQVTVPEIKEVIHGDIKVIHEPGVNMCYDKHPHEPEIPRCLDPDGRCRICAIIRKIEEAHQDVRRLKIDKGSLEKLIRNKDASLSAARDEIKRMSDRIDVLVNENNSLRSAMVIDETRRIDLSCAEVNLAEALSQRDEAIRNSQTNVEKTDQGVKVCWGSHERSNGCEWEHYVSLEEHEKLQEIVRVSRICAKHVGVTQIECPVCKSEEMKGNYDRACQTIARMHEAATGVKGQGPKRGVVEDVEDVRKQMLELQARNDVQFDRLNELQRVIATNEELVTVLRKELTEEKKAHTEAQANLDRITEIVNG